MVTIQRGQIVSPNRAKQIRDFSGLLFGNITPTDIDGLIEYHSKGYIVIEVKLSGAQVPSGQHLALERLTDDLYRAGRPTICIIATHNTTDTDESIDVANAIVYEYRYKRKWIRPDMMFTVRRITEWFINQLDGAMNPAFTGSHNV